MRSRCSLLLPGLFALRSGGKFVVYCACLACVVIQLAIFNSVIRQHWSTSSSLADLEGVRVLHSRVTCPFLTDDPVADT